MKIVKSNLLNENIVVAETSEELDEATAKAKELDAALYTSKEIAYLGETIKGMPKAEKADHLALINKIKKLFDGFYIIPKGWKPEK